MAVYLYGVCEEAAAAPAGEGIDARPLRMVTCAGGSTGGGGLPAAWMRRSVKLIVDAGLLIHEGQLLFPQMGLHRVIDLGVWWHEQTGMPLPLGGNAVRRSLGPEVGRAIARTIRDSVEYGLHRAEQGARGPAERVRK